jgi:hypothetical protein
MQPRSSDEDHYRFLTAATALVQVRLELDERGYPELQILGNRAGLLSLANVLLWLYTNAWRREFLSLGELPFVRLEGSLSVFMRLMDEEPKCCDGLLSRADQGEQFEWTITEEDLRRVALLVHRLVCCPGHEYDRLQMADESTAGVQVRMTDAAEWLQCGNV